MNRPTDVLARYAGAEIVAFVQPRTKHAGELMSVQKLDYPSLELALEDIAEDLVAGRVEKITADGKELSEEELAALTAR